MRFGSAVWKCALEVRFGSEIWRINRLALIVFTVLTIRKNATNNKGCTHFLLANCAAVAF